jgi:hypothetical protein
VRNPCAQQWTDDLLFVGSNQGEVDGTALPRRRRRVGTLDFRNCIRDLKCGNCSLGDGGTPFSDFPGIHSMGRGGLIFEEGPHQ